MNDELPDYYLGHLIYFDYWTPNNCRWVVYDGHGTVRCTSRQSAMHYIESQQPVNSDITRATGEILDAILKRAGDTAARLAQLSTGMVNQAAGQIRQHLIAMRTTLHNALHP